MRSLSPDVTSGDGGSGDPLSITLCGSPFWSPACVTVRAEAPAALSDDEAARDSYDHQLFEVTHMPPLSVRYSCFRSVLISIVLLAAVSAASAAEHDAAPSIAIVPLYGTSVG